MSDYFISIEQAENDLLACAAFMAERIKSSDGHAEAMTAILPRYLAAGEVDLAAELANAVADPFSRDKLLIAVTEKCADINDIEYALQLADAIEDQGIQSQAMERIALIRAGKGDVDEASEIAESIADPDFVYSGIAVNQAASGNHDFSEETLALIDFPSARVLAFLQIAEIQIGNEDTETALVTLDRAATAAHEIEHSEEKIRALCEVGSIFIEAKSNDKAIQTYNQACGFAEVLDNQHHDAFLVQCALGFLNAGSAELADRTLDLVTDKTQMASALLGFAKHYWRKDEKEDAVDALEEAHAIIKSQHEKETRDSRARNALLTSIASQFAAFGKSDRAVETALENQNPKEQVAALSQIGQILTVQKEDAIVRQTINLIEDDADRLFALIAVSDGKVKIGETEAAVNLLDEAAALSETVEQLGPRTSVLNNITERFIGLGHPEKARSIALENLAIIAEIRAESTKAISLADLSEVYRHANFEITDTEKSILKVLSRMF